MILTALSSSSTTYWYLTRSTGTVALILLTLVVVLGVLNRSRLSSDFWPRFITDSLHRRVSLLAVVFLAVHIATAVIDTYAPIGLWDAVIPFHSSYRPLWLGLGAIAFDMLLALIVSSIFRARIGKRAWRAVHWLAYACWPIAVAHGLGTGSDASRAWMLVIDGLCVLSVVAVVVLRIFSIAGLKAHDITTEAVPDDGGVAAAPRLPVGLVPRAADIAPRLPVGLVPRAAPRLRPDR
jgi:sulfoxide reductase heme-binding subunit YedZ